MMGEGQVGGGGESGVGGGSGGQGRGERGFLPFNMQLQLTFLLSTPSPFSYLHFSLVFLCWA